MNEIYVRGSHNPYFNRWFSAIKTKVLPYSIGNDVTILILIDGFLQWNHIQDSVYLNPCHNPYFNRWFSAIQALHYLADAVIVTILILIDGFLQYNN